MSGQHGYRLLHCYIFLLSDPQTQLKATLLHIAQDLMYTVGVLPGPECYDLTQLATVAPLKSRGRHGILFSLMIVHEQPAQFLIM